jgi:hypothetical protein
MSPSEFFTPNANFLPLGASGGRTFRREATGSVKARPTVKIGAIQPVVVPTGGRHKH